MADDTRDDNATTPTISVGFAMMPITTSNFSTEEGKNELVDNLMGMFNEVLNETANKLMAAAGLYCSTMGVTLKALDPKVLNDVLKQAVNQEGGVPEYDEREIRKGIMNAETGSITLDDDYHTATSSGQRTDN